jgi:phosphate transport system substrate-binding protein
MYRPIQPSRLLAAMGTMMSLLLVIAGCSPSMSAAPPTAIPESRPAVNVTLSGTNITVSIISAVQPAFEADQPGYHLDVTARSGAGSSSAPTIQGVADGKLDIAAISRQLSDEESKLGLETAEFGKTATALFTHPDVGVKSLTADQVRAIFTGKVINWAEVGGPKLPIVVFVRAEDNGATTAMRKSLFKELVFAKQSQLVDKSDQLQVAVEGTPGGIGYSGWSGLLVKGTTAHSIALDGIGPTDAGYPILQPLVLCYRSDHKEQVQPLIDWFHSEHGQAALRKIGVIIAK